MTKVLKICALVVLCIPGALLHLTAHLFPMLWPVNDCYVNWLYETFGEDII